MSYDIFYDKQFVKANDKFFPIILCGSSNCFEVGTRNRDGRRSREWFDDKYICNGKYYATRKEIMNRIDKIRQDIIDRNKEYNERNIADGKSEWNDEYNDDSFGYFSSIALRTASTRRTTFSGFKNFYKTGMDKALTIEQLIAEGVNIEIYTYISYSSEPKEPEIELLKNSYPKTTEELLSEVNRFEDYYKDTKYIFYVTFNDSGKWFEEKISRVRQKYFPKKRKGYTYKTVDHYYSVTEPKYGEYFHKLVKYGYKYGYWPKYKFETEKEAQRIVRRYRDRINLSVKEIYEQAQIRITQ